MANFEFNLEHDLRLTVAWKYPPSSEDEKRYRSNMEMAVQEMAIAVGINSEELAKPIVVALMLLGLKKWRIKT